MVMIKDQYGNDAFSVTENEEKLINRIKQKIYHEDSQTIGIIWGGVGSGKSVKAMQLAYAIDPTLEISRVCFNKEDFVDAVIKNKKKVIICDEGISLFFSRASMTKEGRIMSELMAQVRQKNLCILICVPELVTIDWTVVKSANFVGYVWENTREINGNKVTHKGNFAVYPAIPGADFKTKIYHYMKVKRSNPYVKSQRPIPAFTCPGNPVGEQYKKPFYPVNEEAYRKKKEGILDKYQLELKEPEKKLSKHEIKRELEDIMILKARENGIPDNVMATLIDKSERTLRNRRKCIKDGTSPISTKNK